MKNQSWHACMGLVAMLSLAASTEAKRIPLWPYDRLEGQADLIVVATPEASKDSGEIIHGSLWQKDFIGVNTTLQVSGVLKGRYREATLTVFHLRKPKDMVLQNGPYLATFNHQPVERVLPGGKRDLAKREYLLFLKKRKEDGRYEPVSGPMDSAHAIRVLALPTP